MNNVTTIRRVNALDATQIRGLAELLCDGVEGGASVSFMQPLTIERSEAFWRDVAEGVAIGERVLLIAEDASGIVGTVQLVSAGPENQPHRADIAKMLVHRRARRRGLGAGLMRAIEAEASAAGKTLLVLDTVTGGAGERLYARMGWQRCGTIPDYALWPTGGFCATTIFFKAVSPSA
jgi:GNAT superfamily N-acetyltransferase